MEDVIPKPNPPITNDQEPFLKALKTLGGKNLDNLPMFHGKMDVEVVLECIESIENNFEYEGVTEVQKVRVAKYRLKGQALTWWKFVQEERESEGKKPTANW